jgi:hypothetical protein
MIVRFVDLVVFTTRGENGGHYIGDIQRVMADDSRGDYVMTD